MKFFLIFLVISILHGHTSLALDCDSSPSLTAEAVKAILSNLDDSRIQDFIEHIDSIRLVTTCRNSEIIKITFRRKRFIGDTSPFLITVEASTDFSNRNSPRRVYEIVEVK